MVRVSQLSAIAALVAFLLAASLVNHGLVDSVLPSGPGLTLDESFNIDQGVYLVDAFEQHGPLLWTPSTAREVFGSKRFLPDHPPLGRMVLGVAHTMTSWMIAGAETCAFNVPAARLGSCMAFGMTVLLLTEFAKRRYGNSTAILTALMLIGLPHLMGHARLAALESFTNLAWVAALLPLLAWWTGDKAPTNLQCLLSGVLWGMLLLTKVQGVFLPVIVFLWAAWRFRLQSFRPLAIYGIVGASVFFLGWPWLWLHPIDNIQQYLGRTTNRSLLYCWYFGSRYADKSVPWHFPFVTLAMSLPLWTLIGIVLRSSKRSLDRVEQFLLLSIFFPLFMFALPGVPVYDGTRLFLIVMPALAVLCARGYAIWLERVPSSGSSATIGDTPRPVWVRRLVYSSLGLIPLYWTMQPLAISQYGFLAGGNRGAAAMGLEASYWSDGLNADFWNQVPENSTILVAPVSHQFQLSDIEALVPIVQQRRIKLESFKYDPAAQTGNLLLIHRLADLRPELTQVPDGAQVLAEVHQDGVMYARLIDTLPESKPQE